MRDYPLSEDYSRFRVGDIELGKVCTVPLPPAPWSKPIMPVGVDRKNTIWVDTDAELAFLREECHRLEAKLARKDAKIKRLKRKLKRKSGYGESPSRD